MWDPGLPAARATHTPRADRPSVVTVGRLDIVNLDALVTTSSSLRLTVRGLSASLGGGGPGRLAGEVRADRGILLEGEGVTAVLDRVTADVAVGDGALAIRSLIAESGGGDLRLNGRVTFSDGGGYDLKYRSTIELGELRKWWGRAPPAAGRVAVTGSVGGALTDPRVTFDLRARELAVGAISDGRLDATGRASAGGIVVETFSLQSAEGLFKGHGRLALGDGDGPSLLAGEWSLPSLRALAPSLDLHPSSLPALPVSGSANLSWVGSAPAIGTLSGDLHANLRTPGAGALTVAGTAGRWTLRYRQVLAGRNRRGAPPGDGTPCGRSATVEAERTMSTFVRRTSWSSCNSSARWQSRCPPRSTSCAAGRFTARGTVGGSIIEPVVDAFVSAAGVSAGRVDAIQAAGTVHVDRRQMVLKHVAIDAPGGHLELQGSMGFARAEGAGAFEARIDQLGGLALDGPARLASDRIARGNWILERLARSAPSVRSTHGPGADGQRPRVRNRGRRSGARWRRSARTRTCGSPSAAVTCALTAATTSARATCRRSSRGAASAAHFADCGRPRRTLLTVPDAELENVSIDMRLDGSVLQPTGDVSLTADAVRLSGRDAGAIVAHAHAEQGQVRFDLATPRFNADADWNHCGGVAVAVHGERDGERHRRGSRLDARGREPRDPGRHHRSALRIGSGPREPRRALTLERDDGCTGTRRAGAWAADRAGSAHTSQLRR